MKIGYCVEGSTDRAVLEGLRRRWCPQAVLAEGKFRGSFKRREIPGVCRELAAKGCAVIILLRDANKELWRDVRAEDRQSVSSDHLHFTVIGVCDRNVECWLSADHAYLASRTGANPKIVEQFGSDDPKKAVSAAFRITAIDRREEEIAAAVLSAPLRNWLANESFKAFYEELRNLSKTLGCHIENILDRPD